MLAFDLSVPRPPIKSGFVEPMECLPVSDLPTGSQWLWELKLDGYRAIALKSAGKINLYSRNGKSFDKKFSTIAEALRELPEDTIIDGEIVALDDSVRPDFNLLQNSVCAAGRVRFFVFDILRYKRRDATGLSLVERRKLLAAIKFKSGWISIADYFEADSSDLVKAAREQGLEGVVGKRKDSLYEPGKRSGAWIKHRLTWARNSSSAASLPVRRVWIPSSAATTAART
jgi:ATP-dependent DNA ligase